MQRHHTAPRDQLLSRPCSILEGLEEEEEEEGRDTEPPQAHMRKKGVRPSPMPKGVFMRKKENSAASRPRDRADRSQH